jgi:hypothetical protein
MKVVFAPSGKRIIPYPPVGPAVLAGALNSAGIPAQAIDLEILSWQSHSQSAAGERRVTFDPYKILTDETWGPELQQFARRLTELCHYDPAEPLGISTMGYEQLAASMALCKVALASGSRVILGGQFWTEKTARRVLGILQSPHVTIVTSDGYEAIVQWYKGEALPINCFRWSEGEVVAGPRKTATTRPPIPDYSRASWSAYDGYARKMLGATRQIRRAHLYVWDKQCPYKCTFCRVSTGSNVKLSSPESVAASMAELLELEVGQLNFMTNELNPTLSYMRRFIRALDPHLSGKRDLAWFTYLRPDFMEAKDLADLRRLGCRLVRYGVETGSQRLSDQMRKDYRIETIEAVLKHASDAGIMNHINFLVGFPGETEEDVHQSLEFVDRVRPYVHSVRINPFYLPPDSPMARDPESNGIKLKEFRNGYWDFELLNGTRTHSAIVEDRIQRLTERLRSHGIGFAGVLPFETLDYLARYESRDAALAAMEIERPYMWETSSSDALKAHLGGYSVPVDWQSNIYQRGKNYSLAICND